jgi:hypothetical protein
MRQNTLISQRRKNRRTPGTVNKTRLHYRRRRCRVYNRRKKQNGGEPNIDDKSNIQKLDEHFQCYSPHPPTETSIVLGVFAHGTIIPEELENTSDLFWYSPRYDDFDTFHIEGSFSRDQYVYVMQDKYAKIQNKESEITPETHLDILKSYCTNLVTDISHASHMNGTLTKHYSNNIYGLISSVFNIVLPTLRDMCLPNSIFKGEHDKKIKTIFLKLRRIYELNFNAPNGESDFFYNHHREDYKKDISENLFNLYEELVTILTNKDVLDTITDDKKKAQIMMILNLINKNILKFGNKDMFRFMKINCSEFRVPRYDKYHQFDTKFNYNLVMFYHSPLNKDGEKPNFDDLKIKHETIEDNYSLIESFFIKKNTFVVSKIESFCGKDNFLLSELFHHFNKQFKHVYIYDFSCQIKHGNWGNKEIDGLFSIPKPPSLYRRNTTRKYSFTFNRDFIPVYKNPSSKGGGAGRLLQRQPAATRRRYT